MPKKKSMRPGATAPPPQARRAPVFNTHLGRARIAKEDEFYTQLSAIERELRHYKQHFRDKVVCLNSDDPRGGLLDLSPLEHLDRDLAPHEALLQQHRQGAEPVLARGAHREHEVLLFDRGVAALEVEAVGQLARGLVHGVA
jgi:hypothetical protein